MKLREISRLDQIAFADLVDRAHDEQFATRFPKKGSFSKMDRRGRSYWYFRHGELLPDGTTKQTAQYVGPADDPEINTRVENWQRQKADYLTRRKLASQLRRSGLPSPTKTEGEVIDCLAKAGLFRLRGILVGSHAFQTYSGMLSVKLNDALYVTQDVDLAHFYSISVHIDDATEDFGALLNQVDGSFEPIVDPADPKLVVGYRNLEGLKVEVLTTNRGDAAYGDHLTKVPALGGVGAQPLPFLDFLIREPVKSVILHDAGVGVVVPSPERYAVHKLIVATRRNFSEGRSKVAKDLGQAASLISAMTEIKQDFELGSAWIEAWDRGPNFRKYLSLGLRRLPKEQQDQMQQAVTHAAATIGKGYA